MAEPTGCTDENAEKARVRERPASREERPPPELRKTRDRVVTPRGFHLYL